MRAEITDDLIGHFVDQARRSGASWSEIGQGMGVTKQAGQKRFVDKAGVEAPDLDASHGFSRFDEDARKVLKLSVREALRMGHNHVGTEHILLALLEHANGDGILATAGLERAAAEGFVTGELARESAAQGQAREKHA